jgi:hypothetical protein
MHAARNPNKITNNRPINAMSSNQDSRHCERSEAIQSTGQHWIASSLCSSQ